jgi:phosphoribosylformimino-5-aminoimidazole carboxamide ribotide isomerase
VKEVNTKNAGLSHKTLLDFIIPAIDIINGKCVRLRQGDYSKVTEYNGTPLDMALMYQDAGLTRLHLVDLDGAKAGKVTNWKVLETIATKSKMIIDFGGGIKTLSDVDVVINSGAGMATIGSLAVKNEIEFLSWLQKYEASKFFIGADVKDKMIAINGWLKISDINVFDFLNNYKTKGFTNFFCTDVAKDGMLQGPSTQLYNEIHEKCEGVNLVASGGVSSINDVNELMKTKCKGVIIGKAIYEGKLRLNELKNAK